MCVHYYNIFRDVFVEIMTFSSVYILFYTKFLEFNDCFMIFIFIFYFIFNHFTINDEKCLVNFKEKNNIK